MENKALFSGNLELHGSKGWFNFDLDREGRRYTVSRMTVDCMGYDSWVGLGFLRYVPGESNRALYKRAVDTLYR